MRSTERWIVGALFALALLAFFFPLASLQLPVVGKIEASGYDFLSKSRQFENRLGNLSNQAPDRSEEAPTSSDLPTTRTIPLPVSVETIQLLPFEILGSFGLSAVSLLLCMVGSSRGTAKASSIIAGVLGIGSILHIVIADSDLHTWFQAQMQSSTNGMSDNPFAALAQNIGALIANAVHFQPGPGLYALAASASAGALLLQSGLLSGRGYDGISEQAEERSSDDRGPRLFAFTVLAAIAIVAGLFVLRHDAPSQSSERPGKSATPAPASSASTPEPLTSGPAAESGAPTTKSQLVDALNEISAKQGHNHLYSICDEFTLCVMDADAPNDGFIQGFTSNALVAGKLSDAGFKNLVIANGSHAWGWEITGETYSPIPEAGQPQETPPEQ
jgi:hypothetical protein